MARAIDFHRPSCVTGLKQRRLNHWCQLLNTEIKITLLFQNKSRVLITFYCWNVHVSNCYMENCRRRCCFEWLVRLKGVRNVLVELLLTSP